MLEFGQVDQSSRRQRLQVFLSIVFHLLVVASFFRWGHVQIAPMLLPGTRDGSRMSLAYLPGRTSQQAPVALPKAHPEPPSVADAKMSAPVTPPAAPTASPSLNSSHDPTSNQGLDNLGSGDIHIALLSHFPSPQPNLSELPRGTAGDVVLDVVIDETGKITEIRKLRGLAPMVDQTVIATVQGWTYHPALKNGRPVPSEQELYFHYERT
jgi:protein TonB